MGLPLHRFPYDDFQQEAIAAIEQHTSVLVSAPTGSGKTVIAEYAIALALSRGEQAIYTAPVKALSNQKYRDFRARYGEDSVGIVTGDVVINQAAPLRVMTTEIYRNTLLEDSGRLENTSWVIFDEVHYLDDPDRGTVWEESMMFTPHHIHMVCLSATIPNAQELSAWMQQSHDRPLTVIETSHRPVPLSLFYQCQGEVYESLGDLKRCGFHGKDDWNRARHVRSRHRRRGDYYRKPDTKPNRIDRLIKRLLHEQRLPAIYFAFGRRWAEELAWELAHTGMRFLSEQERGTLLESYDALCHQYDVTTERSAQEYRAILKKGVAYHHAGMLPTLKEVIEQLFSQRLIKLIITTETFALGINMPARTVVLDTLQKRMGPRTEMLMCRQFYQMAGRAGRRGMDEQGFVYARVNPNQVTCTEVVRVVAGQPEAVHSRFNTAYATLLNLYRQYQRQVLDIYPKTFHSFQSAAYQQRQGLVAIERRLELLDVLGYINDVGLTHKGEFSSWMYGYELPLAELHEAGILDTLDPVQLAILLGALIYAPRRGRPEPRKHPMAADLDTLCEPLLKPVHKLERKLQIRPHTKSPHFHLAQAIASWMCEKDFDTVVALGEVDEGELVRNFRMIIQLLRQLIQAPTSTTAPALRATAREAMTRINRDVVDAEKQLRSS